MSPPVADWPTRWHSSRRLAGFFPARWPVAQPSLGAREAPLLSHYRVLRRGGTKTDNSGDGRGCCRLQQNFLVGGLSYVGSRILISVVVSCFVLRASPLSVVLCESWTEIRWGKRKGTCGPARRWQTGTLPAANAFPGRPLPRLFFPALGTSPLSHAPKTRARDPQGGGRTAA